MVKDDDSLELIEARLAIAYRFIKRGSIKGAGKIKAFSGKITVIAVCKKCGHERRLASSDLWQSLCQCGHRYNPRYGK